MTQLTDAIQQMGLPAALNLVRSQPYWWPVSMAVKSARDIFHVIERMGWQTMPELQEWVQACNTGPIPQCEMWRSLVAPQCSVAAADLAPLQWAELESARAAQCDTAADYRGTNSDNWYLIPTEAQLRTIARECVSWRYQHTNTEAGDCDDFTSIARAWLSDQGIGNLAAGKVIARHFAKGLFLYSHAPLLAFSRETVGDPVIAWWWEPQTGILYPTSHAALGNQTKYAPDRVELAWLDF
jgi:hypothetical protein